MPRGGVDVLLGQLSCPGSVAGGDRIPDRVVLLLQGGHERGGIVDVAEGCEDRAAQGVADRSREVGEELIAGGLGDRDVEGRVGVVEDLELMPGVSMIASEALSWARASSVTRAEASAALERSSWTRVSMTSPTLKFASATWRRRTRVRASLAGRR